MEECIECFDEATWVTPGGYAICTRCVKQKERKENENTTK